MKKYQILQLIISLNILIFLTYAQIISDTVELHLIETKNGNQYIDEGEAIYEILYVIVNKVFTIECIF